MASIKDVFHAFSARRAEETFEKKTFKQKQQAIYNETTMQFMLQKQLQDVSKYLSEHEDVETVKIRVASDALPFFQSIKDLIVCNFEDTADPAVFVVTRKEVILT